MKCQKCQASEATHVLLGLSTIRVCAKCYATAAESPPKPEESYYLEGSDGSLHSVTYAQWRAAGNG